MQLVLRTPIEGECKLSGKERGEEPLHQSAGRLAQSKSWRLFLRAVVIRDASYRAGSGVISATPRSKSDGRISRLFAAYGMAIR
jgi:hypothetical protein